MLFFNFFEFFFFFFRIFYYALRRNEAERQYLFSFFLGLFQPILALNEAILEFFNFLNFFAILNFASGREERNYNFYFLPFSASFDLFRPEIEP